MAKAKVHRVSPDVLEVLSRATVDAAGLKLPEQLERAMYMKVVKVIEGLGGKWERRATRHAFHKMTEAELRDRLAGLVETGTFTGLADYGYFTTPPAVVARMLEVLGLPPAGGWTRGLEPSAGDGPLADALAVLVGSRERVTCYEIRAEAATKLKASGYTNVFCQDFLAAPAPPVPAADVVLMNPPFARNDGYRHVLHALKFVRPGGTLVAVLPSGVTFHETGSAVEIRERARLVEELPEGSFVQAGTSVNTALVRLHP